MLPSTAHFYKTNPIFESGLVKQILFYFKTSLFFNEEYHKVKMYIEVVNFVEKNIVVRFCITYDLSKKRKTYDLKMYFRTMPENSVFCYSVQCFVFSIYNSFLKSCSCFESI